MPNFKTHYDNLKVPRNATDKLIKASYKALMQKYHPDKYAGSPQEALRITKILNRSYHVLINPAKRAKHDQWIDTFEARTGSKYQQASTEKPMAGQSPDNKKHERKQSSTSGQPQSTFATRRLTPYLHALIFLLNFSLLFIGIKSGFFILTIISFALLFLQPAYIMYSWVANFVKLFF